MPQQCPECARFLSKALTSGLATAPAPCPKCGTTLTAGMFAESVRPPDAPAVRPPDLPPAEVRADDPSRGRDVLAGWDEPTVGGDRRPAGASPWPGADRGLETQRVAVLVGGAGALGVAVGAALSPRSRTRGAFLGAMVAAIAGVLATSLGRR